MGEWASFAEKASAAERIGNWEPACLPACRQVRNWVLGLRRLGDFLFVRSFSLFHWLSMV